MGFTCSLGSLTCSTLTVDRCPVVIDGLDSARCPHSTSLAAFSQQPIRCDAGAAPAAASTSAPQSAGPGIPAAPSGGSSPSIATRAATTIKTATKALPGSAAAELAKWQRTFDNNAKVDEKCEKCVSSLVIAELRPPRAREQGRGAVRGYHTTPSRGGCRVGADRQRLSSKYRCVGSPSRLLLAGKEIRRCSRPCPCERRALSPRANASYRSHSVHAREGTPGAHADSLSSTLASTRYLDQDAFVNAIAPSGDFEKIAREQFAVLFKVADTRKTGRVAWDEFVVFETILKRPVRIRPLPRTASSRL